MTNKDLLRQYVDSGSMLNQYQVESLPTNILKTYLRRRLIGAEQSAHYRIGEHEYNLMSDEIRVKFFKQLIQSITDGKYKQYVLGIMRHESPGFLLKWEYDEGKRYLSGKNFRKPYLEYRAYSQVPVEDWEFREMGDALKLKYIRFMNMMNPHFGTYYEKLMNDDSDKKDYDEYLSSHKGQHNQLDESVKRHKEILKYNK
jgi:hypothetical protein